MNKSVVLGIDTSNYTTSVAAVDRELNIVSDRRKLLDVKEGETGLIQHEALFQHINNLPELVRQLKDDIEGCRISGISVSTRPRPVEGSYMPVFLAGSELAKSLSAMMDVPLLEVSHQEGHVAAASIGNTELDNEEAFVFFHLSGGTLEAVRTDTFRICGKTLDISFGQLIDRTGVYLGAAFPSGKYLDGLALSAPRDERVRLPKVKVKDGEINLSGIENKVKTIIYNGEAANDVIAASLFDLITHTISDMMRDISEREGLNKFLFCGGVSSSGYIRERLLGSAHSGAEVRFGKPELCSDNAVGTAILGGKKIWH